MWVGVMLASSRCSWKKAKRLKFCFCFFVPSYSPLPPLSPL